MIEFSGIYEVKVKQLKDNLWQAQIKEHKSKTLSTTSLEKGWIEGYGQTPLDAINHAFKVLYLSEKNVLRE